MDREVAYSEAAARGLTYLLSRQRADGSVSDPDQGVDAFCKLPYALTMNGRTREAQRLADWVATNMFTEDGDFTGPNRKSMDDFYRETYTYAGSWLVIGFHRLGRFDLSYPGMRFLLGFQDENTGGFFSAVEGALTRTGSQDVVSTSHCGVACIQMGMLGAACRAGDWLIDLMHQQPDPTRRLYATTDQARISQMDSQLW